MNRTYLISSSAVLLLAAFNSSADLSYNLSDNFDNYANQAAFNSVWSISSGLGLSLSTAHPASGLYAVMNTGSTSTTAQNYRGLATPLNGYNLDFSFAFWDSGNNNARDYGMMYSRTTWGSGTLTNILAIGKYNNSTTSSQYYARIANGSPLLGDGATLSTGGAGWIVLNANVSAGMHTAEIRGMSDPLNPGKDKFNFYIDNVLAGSAGNINDTLYNWVVLGSGLTSSGGYLSFDNVVAAVPEPSSLSLCLLGGIGLAVGLRAWRRPK